MEFALKVQQTLELLQTSSVTFHSQEQFPDPQICNSLVRPSAIIRCTCYTLWRTIRQRFHSRCELHRSQPHPLQSRTTTVAPSYFWDALFVGQQPRRRCSGVPSDSSSATS